MLSNSDQFYPLAKRGLGEYRALSCESEGERYMQKKLKKKNPEPCKSEKDELVTIVYISVGF